MGNYEEYMVVREVMEKEGSLLHEVVELMCERCGEYMVYEGYEMHNTFWRTRSFMCKNKHLATMKLQQPYKGTNRDWTGDKIGEWPRTIL